jgi:quercetin dioxygenase-like cupin family protein/ketosteroid isomerase-like protein
MRKTNLPIRLLLLAVLVTALPLQAFVTPHKKASRDQILAMENQWRTAQLASDTTTMDKILADDYLGIMWNGDVLTKAQQIDRMRNRQIVITGLESTDVNVKFKGPVAIVTSLAHVQATSDNRPLDGDYRYTRIYQRLPTGRWQITNFEMTRVRPMPLGMQITRNGTQPSGKGPSDYFTGTVRIDPIITAPDPARVAAASVTFEPGARTAWHTHPLGQTLFVLSGSGWAQKEGGPKEDIKPGDVIWFAPNEKHWHGATATTAMTHIAMQERENGTPVTWLEQVTNDQYNS